jgi:transposase
MYIFNHLIILKLDRNFMYKPIPFSPSHNSHPHSESQVDRTEPLLTPFQREFLLKSLQDDLRSEYRRRIEIMLLADQGCSQAQISDALGCSPETARYWITMAQAGQAHRWQDRQIGRPRTINERYLERLQELVKNDPRDYGYSFRTWTAQWLSKHLAQEFGIEISDRHINRLLKKQGISTRSRRVQSAPEVSISPESGITIQELSAGEAPILLWPPNLIMNH